MDTTHREKGGHRMVFRNENVLNSLSRFWLICTLVLLGGGFEMGRGKGKGSAGTAEALQFLLPKEGKGYDWSEVVFVFEVGAAS